MGGGRVGKPSCCGVIGCGGMARFCWADGGGSVGAVNSEGVTCPVADDTSHIRVITKAADNTANADAPFYVAVLG